ncbi:hypothetical protein PPNSA23_09950 [Phyllobacterium phragmitis]|uniref:Secreted protein n=1 Tax=Phyllobacterium phragmitis TaxID=2670329 RepID=A0ABQ0GWK0_9HYPH
MVEMVQVTAAVPLVAAVAASGRELMETVKMAVDQLEAPMAVTVVPIRVAAVVQKVPRPKLEMVAMAAVAAGWV